MVARRADVYRVQSSYLRTGVKETVTRFEQDPSMARIVETSMKTTLLILILIVSAGCVGLPPMPMQTYNAPSTYETSRSILQQDGLPGAMEDSCLVEGGE
jgi:hypothetical protein